MSDVLPTAGGCHLDPWTEWPRMMCWTADCLNGSIEVVHVFCISKLLDFSCSLYPPDISDIWCNSFWTWLWTYLQSLRRSAQLGQWSHFFYIILIKPITMPPICIAYSADASMMIMVSFDHSSVSEDTVLFSDRAGSCRDCNLVEVALESALLIVRSLQALTLRHCLDFCLWTACPAFSTSHCSSWQDIMHVWAMYNHIVQ